MNTIIKIMKYANVCIILISQRIVLEEVEKMDYYTSLLTDVRVILSFIFNIPMTLIIMFSIAGHRSDTRSLL